MIDPFITLFHAALIIVPFTLFAVGSFLWRPRLWLHSLPADIAAKVSPKTETEKKLTRFLLLPIYILILPGLSIVSTVTTTGETGLSFAGAILHIYGMWIIVHLWDFIFIDCIAILLINPQRPPIPGTEGAKGWSDYGFHFLGFLKAVFMSALFVLPAAAILSFIL